MAYLPESEADRQRRLQEQGQAGQQIASGTSGVITGGAQGAQQGNPASKGPSRSGAFTNLNSYLQANKQQATQLGQNVAGKVGQQAQAAQTQLGDVENQFKQQADQGSVQRNQQLVQNAVAKPTDFVKDQNNVQAFSRIRNATYQGPQSIQDVQPYQQAQKAVQDANQTVENTKTEAGRFSLVQDQFKRPNYSRGQQRLDQLLLQNDPDSRQAFADVQNKYSGLMGQLDQASSRAQEYAQAKKAETEAARKDVQTALGQLDDPSTPENEAAGAFGDMQNDLRARTESERKRQEDLYNRIKRATAGGEITTMNPFIDADVADALGLREGDKLYDINLSQFGASFNPGNINEQSVANADDYARYAALSQLAGTDKTYLNDSKRAGTANGIMADQNQVRGALAAAQGRYDALMNDRTGVLDNFVNTMASQHGVNGYNITRDSNLDQLRSGLDYFRQVNQFDPEWLANAEAGVGGRGAFSPKAVAYRQLRDWIARHDAMTPDRTVRRK